MAILKIARMGHPVLRHRAAEVADPTAPEIQRLIADMAETLADADGAGLAAPQVHVPLRVVLFRVEGGRADGNGEPEDGPGDSAGKRAERVPLTVLVNPEITILGDETEWGWEACLSLPGLMGLVPRPVHIRYRGLDARGRPLVREARGFHARVVQHECDHLDGVLYPMRMTDLTRFGFVDEMRRVVAAEEDEGEEGNEAPARAAEA